MDYTISPFKSTLQQTAQLMFAWCSSNLYSYSFHFLLILKSFIITRMIDSYIYWGLSKQKLKKLQQKKLQNKKHHWDQFDHTGTKFTFFADRQRVFTEVVIKDNIYEKLRPTTKAYEVSINFRCDFKIQQIIIIIRFKIFRFGLLKSNWKYFKVF